MGKGDYLKFSLESIEGMLLEKEYKWIDGEYKNRNSKIVVENKEGLKGLVLISTLMQGADTKFFFSKNPYTIENIKKWVMENTNYELLSIEYKDAYKPLKFKCKEHGEFELSWNKVFQGRRCQACSNRNTKYTVSEIKDKLKRVNSDIELISEEYIDCFTKMHFKCKIDGFVWQSSWHNILANSNGCPECKRISFMGENNHRYNPNLTEEERIKKRSLIGEQYNIWRNNVYKRDNYTCQCCGSSKSGTLNAHHLNGYGWDKENRTNVDNGITLCEDCHKDFHKIFGYGGNTKEQYKKWINNKVINKSA